MSKGRRLIFVFATSLTLSQAIGQNGALIEDQFREKLEVLRSEFGVNKTIPEEVALPTLVALSYYPELKEIPIEFLFADQCEFLITKPRNKVFSGRRKRVYRILMTNNQDPNNGMVINRVAFNALVGVIGHELSHVRDYSGKSFYSTAMTGIRYSTSKKYRQKLERATDISTVNHGLGYQLFRIRIYFPEEETKAHNSYLDRDEILELIKENESNSPVL